MCNNKTVKNNNWCISPLIEIAIKDINAAKLLFDNSYYPQAVFHVQQAIEKGIKVIIVFFNYISCKNLKRKVGHSVVESMTKAAENLLTSLDHSQLVQILNDILQKLEYLIKKLEEISVAEYIRVRHDGYLNRLKNSLTDIKSVAKEIEVNDEIIQTAEKFLKTYERVRVIRIISDAVSYTHLTLPTN